MTVDDGRVEAEQALLRRMDRFSLWILLLIVMAALLFQGWPSALSVALGGALSALNFRWMAGGVDRLIYGQAKASALSIIFKFIARLILILIVFFAMIRFSFLSPLWALVGFSVYLLSGVVEGIRSLREKG